MTPSRYFPAWVPLLVQTGLTILLAVCVGGAGIDRASACDTRMGGGYPVFSGLAAEGMLAERWPRPACEPRLAFCWLPLAGVAFLCASDSALDELEALSPPWATLARPLAFELRRTLPETRRLHPGCHTRRACHVCAPGGQILYAHR